MKIERIELRVVRLPLVRSFRTSSSIKDHLDHVLVRVDADGLSGWGECASPSDPYYCPETTETCWHMLKDFLGPLVLGKTWEDVDGLVGYYQRVKGNNFAKAGLEMACWDLLGRREGKSLAALLGGTRSEILSGVSLGIEGEPSALFEQIDRYVAEGYRRVKLKVAPGRDVAVVRAVRERYPDLPLQVDANSAYTLADLPTLKRLDGFGLLLIEQPLAHDDIIDHARLQAELSTPVCLDESIHSAEDAHKALDFDACRVINIKVSRVGGLREAKRVHDVCRGRGVPVWCGGMHEFGVGRAANVAIASLDGFTLPGDVSGSDKYYREDVVEPPVLARNGAVPVPTGPGLGHEPVEDRIARHTLRALTLSARSVCRPSQPSMPEHPLVQHLKPLRGAMVEALEALVTRESPSRDKTALDALAGFLADRFGSLGLGVERLPSADGGDHLRLRLGGDNGRPPSLVLCHFDTVWPIGTLRRMPFRADDGRAFGPGVFDMKASLVLCEFAVRALSSLGLSPPRPVVFLFTSDEEIGSPTSRALIEAEARRSAHALVLEPPLSGDRLKTSRKGVGRFTLEVTGRSSHAGVEPEKGVNALVELAHQVLAVARLADGAKGTTLNVGVARGGTTPNVVPAGASMEVDARASSQDEARRVESAMAALRPVLPGASLAVRGGFNRPPMERTPRTVALFERARGVGRTLGLELGEGSTGGGSDGNFTAALGLATLDGLGVPGAGAHADDEQIETDALPGRAALLAALLLEL